MTEHASTVSAQRRRIEDVRVDDIPAAAAALQCSPWALLSALLATRSD